MTTLGNQTGVVLRSASDTEAQLLAELKGKDGLSSVVNSLNESSQALQLIISSMNDVVYMVEPPLMSFLIHDTNAEVVHMVELIMKFDADDVQLTRDVHIMDVNLINLVLASMQDAQGSDRLDLSHVSQSMQQLSTNLIYLMDLTEEVYTLEFLNDVTYLLKDMSKAMKELSGVLYTPRTLKPEDIMQLNRIIVEMNSVVDSMSYILTESTDYLVLHRNGTSDIVKTVWTGSYVYIMNILGLVVFSIAFGVAVGGMGEQGKVVIQFFVATNEAVMKLVMVIMW